jgi:GNAT superfamily N-acetyltransferase
VSIREVELADCESLHRNCLSGNTLEQVRAGIERATAESARGEMAALVAIDGTEVAGCIQVSRNPHRLKRHRAELSDFVIHPSARGHGLARRLTVAAATWARSQGCRILEIDARGDTHAEDVYQALGFTEHGRLSGGLDDNGTIYDQVSFSLAIGSWLG